MHDRDTRNVDKILDEWSGGPVVEEGNVSQEADAAYGDWHGRHDKRKLSWLATTWCSPRDTAAAILAAAGDPDYSYSDRMAAPGKIAAAVGKARTLQFRFGRENSPVLYARGPTKEIKAFAKLGKSFKADEISVDDFQEYEHMVGSYHGLPKDTLPPGESVLRLWWD